MTLFMLCGCLLYRNYKSKELLLYCLCFRKGLALNKHMETPVLWPPHAKGWLIGKDIDAGRDWGQEEKGTTEDEMAGWHHWLDGREFEWTPGVGDGQGVLACCYSWGCKESDTTEWLNWTELNWGVFMEQCVHWVTPFGSHMRFPLAKILGI